MAQVSLIVTAVGIMVYIAHIERRSEVIWGAVTIAICVLCSYLIPWPRINVGIGAAISFIAMFAANLIKPRPPGAI